MLGEGGVLRERSGVPHENVESGGGENDGSGKTGGTGDIWGALRKLGRPEKIGFLED